jgi:hypothetical protein
MLIVSRLPYENTNTFFYNYFKKATLSITSFIHETNVTHHIILLSKNIILHLDRIPSNHLTHLDRAIGAS